MSAVSSTDGLRSRPTDLALSFIQQEPETVSCFARALLRSNRLDAGKRLLFKFGANAAGTASPLTED